eukprot:2620475-Rhodomonas_salina.1
MQSLQLHAGHFDSWELDDMDASLKLCEILRQDLLRAGYAEDIADDCIVGNLLTALKGIPDDAPHAVKWKFSAMTWKTDHSKNHNYMWLVLKGLMQAEIMTYRDEEAKESVSSGRPQKKAKVNWPISMALVAQELSTAVEGITALSARFT